MQERHILGRGVDRYAGATYRTRAGPAKRCLLSTHCPICRVARRKLTTIDYPEDNAVPPRTSSAASPPTRRSPLGAVCLWKPAPSSSILCVRPLSSSPVMARALIVDAMSSFGALEIDARNHPFRCRRRRLGASASRGHPEWSRLARRGALERTRATAFSGAGPVKHNGSTAKNHAYAYTPPTQWSRVRCGVSQYSKRAGSPLSAARYAITAAV